MKTRKLNHLTRESRQAERAAINAAKPSADAVCEAWARWKARREGVVIPSEAKMQFVHPAGSWEPMVAEFALETRFQDRRVWSGRRSYYCPVIEREVVATVPLPPHAQPVRDALAWHAEHQANPIRDLIPYQK